MYKPCIDKKQSTTVFFTVAQLIINILDIYFTVGKVKLLEQIVCQQGSTDCISTSPQKVYNYIYASVTLYVIYVCGNNRQDIIYQPRSVKLYLIHVDYTRFDSMKTPLFYLVALDIPLKLMTFDKIYLFNLLRYISEFYFFYLTLVVPGGKFPYLAKCTFSQSLQCTSHSV